jgi:23S rRNA (cytidine1920-2'-O)/16S rRNA (cytidine1409-2'-O)-methyltransferase
VARNKERVDKLLVERGLAPTRTKAQALVMAGQVFVGEKRIEKPGDQLAIDVALALRGQERFVSRGGHKLEAAIDGIVAFVEQPCGLRVRGTIDSPIAGPAGNVEALLVAERSTGAPAGIDPR